MYKRKAVLVLALASVAAMVAFTGCSSKQQTTPPPVQETVRPAPQPPAPPRVEPKAPEQREDTVPRDLAFTTIYFDFDESSIRADQRSALERNAQLLNQYRTVTVRLEGHCDERGTEEYNMALGQRRADAIQQFLANYGIANSRITTVSYGEMRPAMTGTNEDAWSKNRRCEIVITAR